MKSTAIHGVTMVELVIVIAIGSLALLITTQTTMIAQRTLEAGMVQADAEAKSGALMEQMVNEIKDSGSRFVSWFPTTSTPTTGNVSPSATSTIITFARCSGFIMPVAGAGADPTPEFKHQITYQTRMIGTQLCLERVETCLATAGSPCQFGDPATLYGVPQTQLIATNLSTSRRNAFSVDHEVVGSGSPSFFGIQVIYDGANDRLRLLIAQEWSIDNSNFSTTAAGASNSTRVNAADASKMIHTSFTETVINLKMDN